MTHKYLFLFTCEHASHRIPDSQKELFLGKERWLTSHRGWDPGALIVAKVFAKEFSSPLFAGKYSRLLVDLNRTEDHSDVFSPLTAKLNAKAREKLIATHHRPHWKMVFEHVKNEIAQGHKVIHIGVHSFTPIRKGEVRTADIGLLFDPARKRESAFCTAWQKEIKAYRVKKNSPYKGTGNGLTCSLRQKFPAASYLGIELEMNQRLLKERASIKKLAELLLKTCPWEF